MPRLSFVLGLLLVFVVVAAAMLGGYVPDLFQGPRQDAPNEPAGEPSNGMERPLNADEGDAIALDQVDAPPEGESVPGSDLQADPPPETPAEASAEPGEEGRPPPPGRVYLFWSEFLSAGQAEKFAATLTRQSGVDVQPQKVRGGYRMGLAFSDESDLAGKVEKIESASHFDIDEEDGVRLYVLPEKVFSSRDAAERYAANLSELPGVDVRPLQTNAGFSVGATYSNEADLLGTLEAVESGKASSSID